MVPFIFTKSVVICIHLFSVSIIISPSSMPPPASTITINTYIHFPSPICVLTRTSTHFFEILSHLLIHAIIPCYPIHRSYPCSFSRSFGSSSFFFPTFISPFFGVESSLPSSHPPTRISPQISTSVYFHSFQRTDDCSQHLVASSTHIHQLHNRVY